MSPWDHASHYVAHQVARPSPGPAPFAAQLAQRQARLVAALPHQTATPHITLRWVPGQATPEERLTIAALLLAGTGHAIAPTKEA